MSQPLIKNHYQVVGMMSGTSLDGLDMVFCEFFLKNGIWTFSLKNQETKSYDLNWYEILNNITSLSGLELSQTDLDLGKWMGEAAHHFIEANNITPDFIASHGHTVFHQPEKNLTLQIGNGFAMHHITRLPIINSFRNLDVILGGQGAPLVPMGDRLLFGDYDGCLNLGGIANISTETDQGRIAFDICAANMVLNHISRLLNYEYDPEGSLAASGKPDTSLLDYLNKFDYYQMPFPKSLGYEWVAANIFPVVEEKKDQLSPYDLLATFTRHVAIQIARSIELIPKVKRGNKNILVTGGGAFNTYLLSCIQDYCGDRVQLSVPDQGIIFYKEALIFGLLGTLRARNEVNCLTSVTGCAYDHSGGLIYGNFE